MKQCRCGDPAINGEWIAGIGYAPSLSAAIAAARKDSSMYTPKIGIVLSDDEKAEWLAAAKARRLTLSALIRQAVRKEIENGLRATAVSVIR